MTCCLRCNEPPQRRKGNAVNTTAGPPLRRTGRSAAAVCAALVLVAGCGGGGGNGEAADETALVPAGSGPLPAGDFPEPGVEHVHGLGVDPADGTLFAATHFGLFRIPDAGKAERVANRYQDTMGFTVVGPGQFLGSGHPDFREDSPPLLGLIESADAGRTWQSRSLRGKADFHVLRAAHGAVYGYDSTSQTLLVSADKAGWDRRATVALRDFVVSPGSPDVLLGAGETGLVRSGDGGRSWTGVPGAPAVVVLAWSGDRLVAADSSGTVHVSQDDGATWTTQGSAGGAPEALAVDGTTLYVALDGGRILRSDDLGKSFRLRYAD